MAVVTLNNYQFSVQSFAGGYAGNAGKGAEWLISYTTPGAANDVLSLDLVTSSQTLVESAGDVIGSSPIACLSLANRVYYIAGTSLYFSALGDASQLVQQGIGAGFIDMSNEFAQAEPLTGIAPYQGKLAIFARRSAQIWGISSDPSQFVQIQVLPNTGTMAPLSVQSIGDLDVLYLYDTGIRSLRVRDSSLNATIIDIGTPIDSLVQADLIATTEAQQSSACSTVEPSGGRYWIHLNGTIYVLSYYTSSKIAAWSTYKPTWNNSGTQTIFIPQKFELYNGQVYSTDGVALYQYGGSDNNTYDNSIATVTTPLYDLKSPATLKKARGVDVAITGTWAISFGMNEQVPTSVVASYTGNKSTFPYGSIPVQGDGFHFKFQCQTTGSEYARISSLIFHYIQGQEK